MNHDKLQILLNNKILNKERHISEEERCDIMCRRYEHSNMYIDIIIAIEEMAELTQELSKIKRNKLKSTDIGIIEEIADVKICLFEISKCIFNISSDGLDTAYLKQITKDSYLEDVPVIAIQRMNKLSNELCKIIMDKHEVSESKLIKLIAKVYASIHYLIGFYNLDNEKIVYIEDIKFERVKEK